MPNKHVLIVEDSLDIQRLLEKVLKSAGFIVTCADNGHLAFTVLKQTPNLPGVILLDLMMPEMDGYEFRKLQILDPTFGPIPVVVMTAESGAQQKIKDLGADAFLKKPFASIDVILDTVDKFFV
jgi:two-component system, chemotaxis family, chemotaxis protein CheY